MFSVVGCLAGTSAGDPAPPAKILGSESCSTSGCHGGAGPNRGAYTIWRNFDPHYSSAATLSNGRSAAMARQIGITDPTKSASCTACHAPMEQLSPSLFAKPEVRETELNGVSCANCHGPAEKWLLSHTRPDYPKNALVRLGMRQLSSPYQRANNCVACHQNLADELVEARHPPLIFELDGLLVAEPRHWREDAGFSPAQTWLVGQAVALREAAAQAERQPGERRQAEIEALRAILRATQTGWNGSGDKLVGDADTFARKISGTPFSREQSRALLNRLLRDRGAFDVDAFGSLTGDYRMWARGFYAERLALAIDRLNESLVTDGRGSPLPDGLVNALFDAAKPPKSFNETIATAFVEKLDQLSESFSPKQ